MFQKEKQNGTDGKVIDKWRFIAGKIMAFNGKINKL